MKYVSFDIGYSFIKSELFIIPSVVGNSRKIRYSTGLSSENLLNNLQVRIGNEEFFVGKLAQKQSDQVFYSLEEDRYKSKEANVLLETTLGLLSGNNEKIGVVTGLPLDYLKFKGSLEKSLLGTHEIYINNRKRITYVEDVIVIPQPMGVFFNDLMDSNGTITKKDYANSTVGIVDIGFGSTDIAYVKDMEFIDKYSRSINIAMNSVYKIVSEAIYEEFGVSKELYELEDEITRGYVKVKGEEYYIEELIAHAKEVVAGKLVTWIGTIWKNRPEIDAVIVAGGGGMAMFDYLKEPLDATLSDNAQLAILNGYRKLAKRIGSKVA